MTRRVGIAAAVVVIAGAGAIGGAIGYALVRVSELLDAIDAERFGGPYEFSYRARRP